MPEIEVSDYQRESLIYSLLEENSGSWIGGDFQVAIRSILQQLPLPVLEHLSSKDIVFLAPDRVHGRVLRLNISADDTVIFLSPEILSLPPAELQFVIAHEIAHAFLGHEETWIPSHEAALQDGLKCENAADDLASSWGFETPSWRKQERNKGQ